MGNNKAKPEGIHNPEILGFNRKQRSGLADLPGERKWNLLTITF